jgi:hypothetical protein
MSKKKKSIAKQTQKRPDTFKSFSKCVSTLKKSVYLIARGREETVNNKDLINWKTLGTGFVASPNRFITAAHVINNPNKVEVSQHQDGNKYYLIRNDDNNNWHAHIFEPKINKDIFVYPDIDLAILYLNDGFYKKGNRVFVDKNDFIRISKEFLPIGSEVGILGYPICKLNFANHNINNPKVGNILIRTDKGVINCRYKTSPKHFLYEFTLAFNPGNSGGPIFNIKTGKVVSIVRGHKFIRLAEKENIIPEKKINNFKVYKEKSFIETFTATYSDGFATPTILEPLIIHNIIIS